MEVVPLIPFGGRWLAGSARGLAGQLAGVPGQPAGLCGLAWLAPALYQIKSLVKFLRSYNGFIMIVFGKANFLGLPRTS